MADFAPITKFASVPNLLAARIGFPPKTVQELIEYAKANPGKVTWATSGTGSGGTLAMELFRLNTRIKVVPVGYKSAGPATVGLLTNEADLLFANPGVFMPHIKSGNKVYADTVKVLNDPEIVAQFARDGAQPVGNPPQAFAKEIRDDIVKWAKVINDANIKQQ